MIFRLGQQISPRSSPRSGLRLKIKHKSNGCSSVLLPSDKRYLSSGTVSYVMDENFIKFQLYEVLKVESELFQKGDRYQHVTREIIDESLSTAKKLSEQFYLNHLKRNDANEPRWNAETNEVTIIPEVKTALDQLVANGFLSSHADLELGGMQLPNCVSSPLAFPFTAANCATAAYSFLTIAAGNMLRAVGSPAQHEKYLKPMLAGRFFGTMNLSETQAGSSLGDITTRATKQADGTYSIVGNKMWISGGEHSLSENIIHMVLAKVVNSDGSLPAGVKGISLFIVPKYRVNDDGSLGASNGVALAGLNHKMGYRGTTNCVMSYGQGDEMCVGELLGKEGHGLNTMFLMMNEARVSIGYGASAQGYAGYARSLEYARERRQGRSLLSRDPSAPQTPIISHADVKRMLLAQKAAVEGSLSLCMFGSLLVDKLADQEGLKLSPDKIEELSLLLDTLTPVIKSWPSEWCLEANKWALQIHGGYGYTRDYDLEQIYRDNRLNMIHEGTNGIQSLDLLGRKVGMKNGKGYRVLEEAMKETLRKAQEIADSLQGTDCPEVVGYLNRMKKLEKALTAWKKVTELLLMTAVQGPGGVEKMMANSHEYLNMTGHVVIAWRWLEMESAALPSLYVTPSTTESSTNRDFYVSKCLTSRYFFDHELPKIYPQADLLSSLSDINLVMEDKYF